MKHCIIIGAGITGATAAWRVSQHPGWRVTVYESQPVVGGQLRGAFHGNIPYEPHGPHIFHTANEEVFQIVRSHCDLNSYRHRVKTIAGPDEYTLTWPLQVDELKNLPEWDQIRDELNERPESPDRADFETYAISIMGKTLYEWTCYGYTVKQWGTDPRQLASSFAPKRIDLRDDGDVRMFRDPYQGWCEGGWHNLVESLLKGIDVELGSPVRLSTLPMADAYIITAALDEFLESEPLPWRGVRTRFEVRTSRPHLIAPVVNYPGIDVPYTRMVETAQMSEALPREETVIGFEYPGAPVKHYPVDDVHGENRVWHQSLVRHLQREVPGAVIAGRLAQYVYIDIDQAVIQGLNAAKKVTRGSG